MEVTVRLHDKEGLWPQFHRLGNEMIVTKTGRKMFPKLEFLIEGLDLELYYGVALQMEQVDDSRYKFHDGEWSAAGRGEAALPTTAVVHHDGVMSGAQWMRAPVHFERVKITNNPQDANPSHVFLHSMHKYVPVLTIFEMRQATSFMPPMGASHTQVKKVKFPDTEFITVTAYQNEQTKQLKIKYNPYAKGFREGGDRKRPSSGGSPIESKKMPPTPPALPLISQVSPLWCPTPIAPLWNPYLFMAATSPYRFALQKPF